MTKIYNRCLNGIEKIGNNLPHPILLFTILSGAIILISFICSMFSVSATGELISNGQLAETTIHAVSLLTPEGISYMLTNAVTNFTTYAPLGMVLVAMLGVGVAEHSGLINALLKSAIKITPSKWITPMVIFLGVMSNIVSDAGYVILIPLGAMIFRAYGRHPMAGLAAAFAGVSGGYAANLLIGSLDTLLTGITQSAVDLIDPTYRVNVMGNYFFLIVSTFFITIVGAFVTEKIVEPRLGTFSDELNEEEDDTLTSITPLEKKGLRNAGIVAMLYVIGILLLRISITTFLDSIVILITLLFLLPGIAYGKTVALSTSKMECATP